MQNQEDDVLFKTYKNAGIITLNRPKALNALNLSIVNKLLRQLQDWENTKTAVIIKGAGDKAFCAGGDLKENKFETLRFISTEYNVNYLIGHYKIPYIAFMNGITMGGGMGLSVHGRYRIATEKTVIAMPETKIGLFPDVGGTYFLSRLNGNLGIYLGLTSERLKGGDVLKAGIATHYVNSSRLSDLEEKLSGCTNTDEISRVLDEFNERTGEFSLTPYLQHIDYCFAADTIEEIIERLKTVNNEWSIKTLQVLHKMCPASLKITLLALRRGAKLNLGECLRMEYRMTSRASTTYDLREGIRALLIDKDNNPKWNPRTISEVTGDYVESFFEILPEQKELVFFKSKL
ncbi:3-hydroxyisobutyryl-CoA hydrolase, mitochondrial [Plutella xylostella]|uniref:3-hydroxyisobutyryl-CoA hydrolase, mitochondrial n=1 Tax=Plutella xylostella TaxID=51655 RepID=UPI0020326D24|nr:3-hydroxyisobutyryl-CoA hydrolase, mitochondrial [Plutella xylostella]XP_048479177.1 3-hydroxyisobutyryl-CoA hydrolase, mitochondrial [Plutella xylostella]